MTNALLDYEMIGTRTKGLTCAIQSFQLSARLNPDCPEDICTPDGNALTLIHIRADSDLDTIHYVWDFTGKPTILVALTRKNASLKINWNDFMDAKPSSVQFSETPIYTFMTVINRVRAGD